MLRWFALFSSLFFLTAHASTPLETPENAVKSNQVVQPHVTAELISESPEVAPGQKFSVALHLHMDPGWHTYWINSGDAGLPTSLTWTLPPGFTSGALEWPTPERHPMGGLVTYGYEGDTYLLTTLTAPAGPLPKDLTFQAHATWLVCREECIPGQGDLTLHLKGTTGQALTTYASTTFFLEAKKRLPLANDAKTGWQISGHYEKNQLILNLEHSPIWDSPLPDLSQCHLLFYPEQPNVLDPEKPAQISMHQPATGFDLSLPLEANGETPAQISGVLVSDDPKPYFSPTYFSNFPVTPFTSAPAGLTRLQKIDLATLLIALGGAFLGGLILNLMPCVLPVLALKVFSLVGHADDPRQAWKQGLAFVAGVVLSFWSLAIILLALRAAGQQLGWGFQMQSPGFVLALTYIFFLLGLNLFGVFELGTSLVGLDARVTGRAHGTWASFGQGGLATLAATPCTAPFMGSALGFAAQLPPALALLIFTFLALGMALPYFLLTLFPGALRLIPKPGAWMETARQFLGFPLFGTVIWLLYVLGALTKPDAAIGLLGALLLAGLGVWIYGRWNTLTHSFAVRFMAVLFTVLALILSLFWSWTLTGNSQTKESTVWQPYSPAAVQAELAKGHPVFVDFTAAWCLSCKVNEHFALEPNAVQQAFTEKNVALFRADWTAGSSDITLILQQYHRDGVPLYLLYNPKTPETPQILPELLTPEIVLSSLNSL